MCGISGIYNFSNKPVNLGSAIEKIVKLQHHRGPDDQGIWQSKCKKVFFGHNRLTIIDLSKNGKQHFVSKDENFVITFNGEIYNFIEIRNELAKKNYFVDTAKVFDYYYGTPLENINKSFKKNNHILFDIDWQGAKKIRKRYDQSQIIDFFILPPNKKELKSRLEKRGRDNRREINKRLSLAVSEIKHYKEYQFVLINENIIDTVNNLVKIINNSILIHEIKNKVN